MTVLGLDAWRAVPGETRNASAPTAADVVVALAGAPPGDVLIVAGGVETARAARMALGSLRRSDVALIELSGTPTRRYAVQLGLRLLRPEVYGFADSVVAGLGRVFSTRVLLSSVTRLTDPNPGLVDHVASWFPGLMFAVDLDSREVGRTRMPQLTLAGGELAVVATQWARPDELELAPLPASCVDLTGPPGSAPWRARQWAEVTVARASLTEIVDRALSGSLSRACPSCARPVTGVCCRFCGIVVPEATAQAPVTSLFVPESFKPEETFA